MTQAGFRIQAGVTMRWDVEMNRAIYRAVVRTYGAEGVRMFESTWTTSREQAEKMREEAVRVARSEAARHGLALDERTS